LGEEQPDLLAAALLHDVGKSDHPLHIWERVVIVLGKAFFPGQVRRWGQGEPTGWRRPFVVAEQHPAWGADMAAEAGASPTTATLIRHHQDLLVASGSQDTPPSPITLLLLPLQALDNEN